MTKEQVGLIFCDTLDEAKTKAWELLNDPSIENVLISNWTRYGKGWRVSPSYDNSTYASCIKA